MLSSVHVHIHVISTTSSSQRGSTSAPRTAVNTPVDVEAVMGRLMGMVDWDVWMWCLRVHAKTTEMRVGYASEE